MLQFTGNSIQQTINGAEKNWSIVDLLETYNPMPDEPLSERNNAFQQTLPLAADMYNSLSETARLRYDFWKNLMPHTLSEQCYTYTTRVTNTYQWELTINSNGLFYKDLTPEYSQWSGKVHEQLFSDFWFYGPLLPIPDLVIRKQIIAQISTAFLKTDNPILDTHFELFEYPMLHEKLSWEIGEINILVQDFVIVRAYGIESGRSNFRDGVYLNYTSFERFLTQPNVDKSYLIADIRAAIETYLGRKTIKIIT